MFGRKSRAQLAAEAADERARREALERATQRPRWVRALRAVPWPLALLLVATIGPLAIAALAARGTWWAWKAWPRPTTVALATPWAVLGGPWWGTAPIAATAAAALWWHARTHPTPTRVVEADPHVAVWRTEVAAGPDAPVPGSTVADDVDPIRVDPTQPWSRPVGRVIHGTGRDSTQHVGWVRSQIPRLAAIYRVSEEAITVRGVGDNRRWRVEILDQAYVEERAVVRRARVTDVQPWTGPSFDDQGRFRVLTAAATGLPGHGQVYVPGGQGARNVDVNGLQGTGKSNTVHLVNASILSRGIAVMDLVDLKGGASLPAWRQCAWRYGSTRDAALLALLRWCVVVDVRTETLAAMPRLTPDGQPVLTRTGAPAIGVECIDPTAAWPLYVLEIDEFPQIARHKPARPLIKRGLELQRAAQCLLVVAHQGTAQADGYGDDALTRGLLTNGTVVAMRNDAAAAGRVIGAGGVDLSTLGKDTPGEAVLTSSCEPGQVYGRVEYVGDPWAAAARTIPGTLEERTAERVALLEAHVDRWGVERIAALYEAQQWPAGVAALEQAAAAGAGPVVSGVVATIPSVTSEPTAAELGAEDRIRAVFAAAGVGVALRTGEVLGRADVASSTFHAASKRLVKAGQVVDLGPGQWAATAALVGDVRSRA